MKNEIMIIMKMSVKNNNDNENNEIIMKVMKWIKKWNNDNNNE